MATVIAHLRVDLDGRVSGRVPTSVPPGDYTAPLEAVRLTSVEGSARPKLELPIDDEPWDDRIPLRREDLYGDEGAEGGCSSTPTS